MLGGPLVSISIGRKISAGGKPLDHSRRLAAERRDRRPPAPIDPIEPFADDDNRAHVDVIEHDHPVVEGERQVGELTVVFRRIGEPLGVADDIVSGVRPDAPAGE